MPSASVVRHSLAVIAEFGMARRIAFDTGSRRHFQFAAVPVLVPFNFTRTDAIGRTGGNLPGVHTSWIDWPLAISSERNRFQKKYLDTREGSESLAPHLEHSRLVELGLTTFKADVRTSNLLD